MSDTVNPDKYLVQKLHRSFGPSTCRHCGKSYTLPGEHKCSPTYTELQATVKRLCDGIETVNNACVEKTRALQAEVKRLEGELAAYRDKRAVDGLNGRMWDAGKHLAAEKKIEALKENEK